MISAYFVSLLTPPLRCAFDTVNYLLARVDVMCYVDVVFFSRDDVCFSFFVCVRLCCELACRLRTNVVLQCMAAEIASYTSERYT